MSFHQVAPRQAIRKASELPDGVIGKQDWIRLEKLSSSRSIRSIRKAQRVNVALAKAFEKGISQEAQ